jgi:hypothetical protein
MKIIAFMPVYNEERFLATSLESVSDLVDGYVLVDGRFIGNNEGGSMLSTDRTKEIALQFPNMTYVELTDPVYFLDFLNTYRQYNADWYVITEGHNVIIGDLTRLRNEIAYGIFKLAVQIPVYHSLDRVVKGECAYYPRVFSKESGMHWIKNHWDYRMNGEVDAYSVTPKVDYVQLITFSDILSKERRAMKEKYYLYRVQHGGKGW